MDCDRIFSDNSTIVIYSVTYFNAFLMFVFFFLISSCVVLGKISIKKFTCSSFLDKLDRYSDMPDVIIKPADVFLTTIALTNALAFSLHLAIHMVGFPLPLKKGNRLF